MGRNKPGDKWRSTPNAKRRNKETKFTLTPEARAALEAMAPEGTRSDFVSGLIVAEFDRRKAGKPT